MPGGLIFKIEDSVFDGLAVAGKVMATVVDAELRFRLGR